MRNRLLICLFLAIVLSSCGPSFDKKGINILAKEVKAEMIKLSVPCPVSLDGPEVIGLSKINMRGFDKNEATFEKFKPLTLVYDDMDVRITVNKVTKDGYQFRYQADITEYSLDEPKPTIIRDEGTVWIYCDKYKKHNKVKEEEPNFTPSRMVTVE